LKVFRVFYDFRNKFLFWVKSGGCYVNVRSMGKIGQNKTSKNAPEPFNPLALFGFVFLEPEDGFILIILL